MGQPRCGVNSNVRLHVEVPLVALFSLVHLGVALAVLVLRRGRRSDDRGIDHCAFPQQQAAGGEMHVDGGEDTLGQLVCFQQTAELEERSGIRCRFAAEVDADEATDRMAVVKGVFRSLVRQPEALLGNVHAQHTREADRRAATSFAFGVERFHLRQQRRLRRHGVNLAEKAVAPRDFLLGGVFEVRKASLHRRLRSIISM